MSDVIEDLKLGKLILHKYVENVKIESDKINQLGMSDDNDSAEIDDISKNYEETLTDIDEESE